MKTVFLILSSFLFITQVYSQWQMINSPSSSVRDMLILQNGKILAGTNSGLFTSSDNGISWNSTSVIEMVNHIKKDNFGNIYTSADYLYRSTDEGSTWEIPYSIGSYTPANVHNLSINSLGELLTIHRPNPTILPEVKLLALKSTNSGTTWVSIWSRPYFGPGSTTSIGYSIIENSIGDIFISYLFISEFTSSEVKVIKKESGTSNLITILDHKASSSMHIFNNDLYLATRSSFIYSPSGVLKSTDNGNTFTQLNNGLADIEVLQMIPEPEVFIALTGDGIYRSLDLGNYWMRLDHTGLSGTINRIYYSDSKTLYACTSNGIYIFTGELPVELLSFKGTAQAGNVTLTWSTSTELNNRGFEIERSTNKTDWRTIGFKEGNGTTTESHNYSFIDDLFGTNSPKLYYRLKQIDFDGSFEYSDIVEVNVAPTEFSLSQNYPNPFNPATKIQYTISDVIASGAKQSQIVTLKVYDILGREVATLVNEEKQPGIYEVEFDASNISSGIYYYQLKAGNYIETKKMIYLR